MFCFTFFVFLLVFGNTLKFLQSVFSKQKTDDYEHKKVLNRQLEETILLDLALGKGIIEMKKRVFWINRNVLNSKFTTNTSDFWPHSRYLGHLGY